MKSNPKKSNRFANFLKIRSRSIGNRGSTLVIVLVAAGIGIIVAYSMSTLIRDMYLSENGVKFRMDADTLNEEIRGLLSSPQSCLNTFGELVVNTTSNLPITQIMDASAAPGTARFSEGQVYGAVQINTMTLSGFINTGVPNTAQMTLTNLTSSSKASSGVRDLTRTINLHVEFDLSNKVTACISLSKMSDGIWRRSNPAQDNIYYVGALVGNVGIGTSTPTHRLSIQGDGVSTSLGAINVGKDWDSGGFQKGSLTSSDESTGKYQVLDIGGKDIRLIPALDNTGAPNGPIAMFIQNTTGNVGIGTSNPSTLFHVVGSPAATIATFSDGGSATCTVTPASTGFACSSDKRLKKNIEPFSDEKSLENILQLKTVTYDWRSIDNGRHTGYIAQELEKVAPEFVRTGEDGFKQVYYTGLVPWITGAIKAFYAEFKASMGVVNSRINILEAENVVLKIKTSKLASDNIILKDRLDRQGRELTAIKNKLGL